MTSHESNEINFIWKMGVFEWCGPDQVNLTIKLNAHKTSTIVMNNFRTEIAISISKHQFQFAFDYIPISHFSNLVAVSM